MVIYITLLINTLISSQCLTDRSGKIPKFVLAPFEGGGMLIQSNNH